MIIEQEKEIKVSYQVLQHYLDKGYDAKIGEKIKVKNEDLTLGSKVLENRICDEDGMEYSRPHRAWVHTYNSFGMDLCPNCAKKKRQEKIKSTNMLRYGVEYPMQSKEIKDKAKETTKKNYGCDFSFQSPLIQDRAKNSILNKNQGLYPAQTEQVKAKIKKTNLEKYGCINVFQNTNIKKKIKDSLKNKYGVDNISQVEEIKEIKKNTMLEKYGVEFPLQSKEFQEKKEKTNLQRYGVKHAMQNKEIKEKAVMKLNQNGGIPCSSQQKELFELISKEFPDYLVSLNVCIGALVLDIECATKSGLKIDIEYDGNYWHKDANKDRRRDEFLKSKGYKILRVKSGKKIPTVSQLKEAFDYLENNLDKTFSQIILDDWTN